jgi:hypothetical protein
VSITPRIERLCVAAGEGEFSDFVHIVDADALVDRVFAAVRGGAADPSALEADLNVLDAAFAAIGIDGLTSGAREYRRVEFDAGHPRLHAWVCPLKVCARAVSTNDWPTAPQCTIAATPLALLRTRA